MQIFDSISHIETPK